MNKKTNSKWLGYILLFLSMVTVIVSFAFFTDRKEDRIGVGVASNTSPYIVFEYDLSRGESYVNISDKDLSKVKVRVYDGDYLSNKSKIEAGFKESDYELENLKSTEDLRVKLGKDEGLITVVSTSFDTTGNSFNNKGLVSVPYFDSVGLGTEDLAGMFKGASSFNQVINNWNINNVVNMDNMFEGASSYNHDLFNWNTQIKSKPVDFNKGATNLPDYKLPRDWQESYKVIFKDQGNVVKTITGGYQNRTLESTSKDDLSIPKEPVREGYIFKGWESSEGLAYGKKMLMPNNDLIYESQWEKKSVEVDDGEGGKIEVEVDDEGNVTLPTLPDKEEEDFEGWEDEDGNKVEGGTDVDYTEGDKYTPIWKPKEYTVRFESVGRLIEEQKVKHGKSALAPSNPTREGYIFTGWDKDFSNITGNITVNAKWSIRQYTVTFRGHNNTILKTQTVNHGGNATAPSNPTREGYIFEGWDKVFTNITGNITVNAKWKINSYTFSYTGGNQTFNVDVGGKYKIDVSGARGVSSGGYGGRASATFDLYRGDNVVVYVGGPGQGTVVRVNGSVIIAGGGGGGGSYGGAVGGTGGSGTYNGTTGSPGGSYTETYEGYWGTAWGTRYWTDENGVRQSETGSWPHWNEGGTRTVSYSSTPGDGGKNEIASRGTNKLLQNGVNSGNGRASITWLE